MKHVYVWYSAATDITGKKLVEALGCSGGVAKPTSKDVTTVICWGAKTTKATVFPAHMKVVYNHPDKIRGNRNKFKALEAMGAKKCNVAKFSSSFAAANGVTFPCIARKNFHQGGKGFWLCLNKEGAAIAKGEGAQYVQEFLNIKDEYRLHVVGGKVVHAVKKTIRENMRDAYVAQHTEKITNWAEKNNHDLDKDTVEKVLRRVARYEAEKPDYIVRSNTKGWKFSQVKTPPAALVEQAVSAIDALGLNYGAVDCCVDYDGKPWIIEVNSGPGLDGTPFKAWVAEFKKLAEPEVKKPAAKKKEAPAKKAPAKKAADKVVAKAKGGAKAELAGKLALMGEMLKAADEDEAEVLNKLFGKVANNGDNK